MVSMSHLVFFFLMIRRPPRSTRTDTLFPYTTLFRARSRRLGYRRDSPGKPVSDLVDLADFHDQWRRQRDDVAGDADQHGFVEAAVDYLQRPLDGGDLARFQLDACDQADRAYVAHPRRLGEARTIGRETGRKS